MLQLQCSFDIISAWGPVFLGSGASALGWGLRHRGSSFNFYGSLLCYVETRQLPATENGWAHSIIIIATILEYSLN